VVPVWGGRDAVVAFVARLAGCRPDFGNCQTMAVLDKDGRLVAGLVFHNYSPEYGVIEVSAAATTPKWATRQVLNEALGYVFAHCQMAVARIAEDNQPARRLWKALGATEIILPRMRGRGASEAVLLLTDDAWAQSKLKR
jgi:RimJ/RimL family protein N-acetyltransferase